MRVLLACALLVPSPQEASDVQGKVTLAPGAVPRKRLKVAYKGPGLAARKPESPAPIVVWLEGPSASKAEGKTAEMLQEGLEFRPRVLAVQAGTTVKFPNGDDVQHNVFSYSKPKRFDLGRYPKGESKDVVFDQKGLVEISCEVHEHMRGYVLVVEHSWFALAKEDGSYVLPKVPAGKHTLVAWKEGFDPVRKEIEVGGKGAAVDLQIAREGEVLPDRTGGCCR
ncbi:MAG TPA: plastocyanin/azurin family copper-binding protein [Planctomycetota bacterium]